VGIWGYGDMGRLTPYTVPRVGRGPRQTRPFNIPNLATPPGILAPEPSYPPGTPASTLTRPATAAPSGRLSESRRQLLPPVRTPRAGGPQSRAVGASEGMAGGVGVEARGAQGRGETP